MESAVVTFRHAVIAATVVTKQLEATGDQPNTVSFLEGVRRTRRELGILSTQLETLEADAVRVLEASGIDPNLVPLSR